MPNILTSASRLLQRGTNRLRRRGAANRPADRYASPPSPGTPPERSAPVADEPATSDETGTAAEKTAAGYPGDYTGTPDISYDPNPDGEPDPGEVVWAWVPYEEDHSQGKDRPVLLIGRDGPWLLALQMSRKNGDEDYDWERRNGRRWVDIGAGGWDQQRRPSEVRVNRILRIDPGAIRREGAVLDEAVFEHVRTAVEAATG